MKDRLWIKIYFVAYTEESQIKYARKFNIFSDAIEWIDERENYFIIEGSALEPIDKAEGKY